MKDDVVLFRPMCRSLFDHLSTFTTIEVAGKMFEVAGLKIKGETISDNLLSHGFPSLAEADRLFWHKLSRAGFEMEQLYLLTGKPFHKKIDALLQQDIDWIEEELNEKSMLDKLRWSNDNFAGIKEDRAGEIRKYSMPRGDKERMDLSAIPPVVMKEYLRIVENYYDLVIENWQGFRSDDFKVQLASAYNEPQLKDYIEDWEKFIGICDELTVPVSFEQRKQSIVRKDEDGTYTWIGLSDAPVPSLGQFIFKLQRLGMIRHCRYHIQIARMFLRFFNLQDTIKDPDFLAKQLRGKEYSRYSTAFSNLK